MQRESCAYSLEYTTYRHVELAIYCARFVAVYSVYSSSQNEAIAVICVWALRVHFWHDIWLLD